jgi:hypothetical protein
MRERRTGKRVQEEAQAAVTVLSAEDAPELVNKTFFCPTENLSVTGLRLSVQANVPVGSVLELRIAFTQPLRSFQHTGRVVWIRKDDRGRLTHALGIEFTHVSIEVEDAWRDMIARKLKRQGGVSAD